MGRMKPSNKRRRSKQKKVVATVWSMVLVIVCITGVASVSLVQKNNEYAVMQDELDKQLKEEQDRTKQIAEYKEYVATDEYVEEIARDKLGLVYENEIVLKPKS